jgi:undecaprenyl-diphosphatase
MTESVQYLILAVIQAATEFLPVSSSGHLLFLKGLMHIEEIPVLFDIVVHVGSLLAIVAFFRKTLIETIRGAWRECYSKDQKKPHLRLLLFIIVSTLITFAFYTLFKQRIENSYGSPQILVYTFGFTTVLIFSTAFLKEGKSSIPEKGFHLPILVGLFQGLAIMPGISRSGSTITPLLYFGIRRDRAGFYSFALAIPAILGALLFKLIEVDSIAYMKSHGLILGLSLLVSTIFSFFFLALLMFVLRRKKFWLFSLYTAAMAVVSLILFSGGGGGVF